MLMFRVPRGNFKGGVIRNSVSPTITANTYECNNFIIEIKRIE